ncbi:MAG: hypothetical protein Alpg2KO_16380 [Alphaproteobacteria bacterium]
MKLNARAHSDLRRTEPVSSRGYGKTTGLTGLSLVLALGLMPDSANAIYIQENADLAGSDDPLIGFSQFDADNVFSNSAAVYFFNESGEVEGLCSGTLIDSRTVVTAAHCISDDVNDGTLQTWVSFLPDVFEDADDIGLEDVPFKQINAPDIGLVGGSQVISVNRHPDFDGTGTIDGQFVGDEAQDYDIALLTLQDSFVGNNLGEDRFALLPDVELETGQEVFIVGYGQRGTGLQEETDGTGLKIYATNVVDLIEQEGTAETSVLVSDFDVAAGVILLDPDGALGVGDGTFNFITQTTNIGEETGIQNEGTTSFGDSGGGMFIRDEETGELTLVGVASGIQIPPFFNSGNYGQLASHSNVFEYLDFIAQTSSDQTVSPRSGDRTFGSTSTWEDGVVPENSSSENFADGLTFYEVVMDEEGTLTVDATHVIEDFVIDNEDAVLNIVEGGNLTTEVDVRVQDGKVQVDGTLNAFRVIVEEGMELSGSGQINIEENGFFFNSDGATLTSTTPGEFLTIDGFYRQKPEARLNVQIEDGGDGSTDGVAGLAVDGRARLRGTLDINFASDFNPQEGEAWTVMTFEELNGEFDNITSNFGPFYEFDASYDDNAVVAQVTRVLEPVEITDTANQLAVAEVLFNLRDSESEGIQSIFDEFSDIDEEDFGTAFESLSPELALAQQSLAHRSMHLFGQQLTSRSRQTRLYANDRLFGGGKTIDGVAWAPKDEVVQVASMEGVGGLLSSGGEQTPSIDYSEFERESRGFMGYAGADSSAQQAQAGGAVYSDVPGYAQPAPVMQQRSAAPASNSRSRRGRYARFGAVAPTVADRAPIKASASAVAPAAAPAMAVTSSRPKGELGWSSAFFEVAETEIRDGFQVAEVTMQANHAMALSGGEGLAAGSMYGDDDGVTTDAPTAVVERERRGSRYAENMGRLRQTGTWGNNKHYSNTRKMGTPNTVTAGAYFESNPYVDIGQQNEGPERYQDQASSAYTMPDTVDQQSDSVFAPEPSRTAPPRPVTQRTRPASRWEQMTEATKEDNVSAKRGERGSRIRNGVSVWTTGDVFIGEQDLSTAVSDNRYSGALISFGADYSFSDSMFFGAAGTIVTADADDSGTVGETKVDGVIGAVYGGAQPIQGLNIDTYAAFGLLNYKTERDATVGSLTEVIDGKTDGFLVGAGVTANYRMTRGNLEFGPVGGVSYSHVNIDGYTERGTTLNTSVEDQSQGRLRLSFGGEARYNWDIGAMVLLPRLKATWEQQFIMGDEGLDAALAADPSVGFTVVGEEGDQGWLALDGGVDVQFSHNTTGYFSYGADLFKEHDFNQNFSAGLRVAF